MHTFNKSILALAALSLVGLAAARPAAAQAATVYSNNFTHGAGPEWSNTSTSTTPGTAAHPADTFLGEFGNQATILTLNGLATHSLVNVTFDLYIIRSMDGNGPFGGGPDPWSVSENGNTLISTNFANFPGDTQSFGGSNGLGGYLTGGTYAPQTGATEANTLGYQFNGPEDAVYHLSFTFNDASSALALNFLGQPNENHQQRELGPRQRGRQDRCLRPCPGSLHDGLLWPLAGTGPGRSRLCPATQLRRVR